MSIEEDFTAYFFSKDSSNKFDNTLSSFTTDLNLPIDFNEQDYEVGLQALYLNHIRDTEYSRVRTHDIISLGTQTDLADSTLRTFVKHILHNSVSPTIYDRSYFANFLDKNYFWDHQQMEHNFKSIFIAENEFVDNNSFTVAIDISKLVMTHETLEKFIPFQTKPAKGSKEEFGVFKVSIFRKEQMAMNQILLQILLQMLDILRSAAKISNFQNKASRVSIKHHAKNTAEQLGKETEEESIRIGKAVETPSRLTLDKRRRAHLHIVNVMMHRIVEHFIDLIQEENELLNTEAEELTSLPVVRQSLFVYTDIIKQQFIGDKIGKLLYFTMLNSRSEQPIHLNIFPIQYCRLEKRLLNTVSFVIADEFGTAIDFSPTPISNVIVLRFRKIVK